MHPDSASNFATGNDRPKPWELVVRSGLTARKNGASEAEIKRIARTLERLEASAAEAISHTQLAGFEKATQEFAATLQVLGND